jgi:hypothetical protein
MPGFPGVHAGSQRISRETTDNLNPGAAIRIEVSFADKVLQ